jgi:hypothetical protein
MDKEKALTAHKAQIYRQGEIPEGSHPHHTTTQKDTAYEAHTDTCIDREKIEPGGVKGTVK